MPGDAMFILEVLTAEITVHGGLSFVKVSKSLNECQTRNK